MKEKSARPQDQIDVQALRQRKEIGEIILSPLIFLIYRRKIVMKQRMQPVLIILVMVILFLQLSGFWNRADSARQYHYKVISVTGTTQLRTQEDAEKGRVAAIENLINEQAGQGWEFFQADGYLLYFRR